jgi:antitoxin (DNA-binding transcriptional repressor) of toxin-antitoxin stability system
MTTTLQQMIAEPAPLLARAQRGEEIVLTDGGRPVVKVTGVPVPKPEQSPEEVVAELRSARRVLTEEEMQRRREWMGRVSRHAAAASTGKAGGPTTEQIIEELREERC